MSTDSLRSITSTNTQASKKVTTKRIKLYETDASKYAGPHRLQQTWAARQLRKNLRRYAYTQYSSVFTEMSVTGLEHVTNLSGPAIFIGNHSSHLDTVLTQTALPDNIADKLLYGAAQDRWFVKSQRKKGQHKKGQRKKELNPLYQSFVLGTFPIRRGGGAKALSYASELLEHDHHIFLFPEGTRATANELGEFKPGVALLAIKHQVPVIPLYLHGLAAIRPKGTRRQIPGPVSMDILPAQHFSTEHDVAQATFQLRASMNAARNHRLGVAQLTEDTPLQKSAERADLPLPTSAERAA